MFRKNTILIDTTNPDNKLINMDFTDALKPLSIIERNAAIALTVGLSQSNGIIDTPENLRSQWNTSYRNKLKNELQVLQNKITINIPFILKAACDVYVIKNSTTLRSCIAAIGDYLSSNAGNEVEIAFDLECTAKSCIFDTTFDKGSVLLTPFNCGLDEVVNNIIYTSVKDYFDTHTTQPVSEYNNVIKLIKNYFSGVSLLNINNGVHYYDLDGGECFYDFKLDIPDNGLNNIKVFLMLVENLFRSSIFPAEYYETIISLPTNDNFIRRSDILSFPLRFIWECEICNSDGSKDDSTDTDSDPEVVLESLEREFNINMLELEKNIFSLGKLENIQNSLLSNKSKTIKLEDIHYLKPYVEDKTIRNYTEEDYKEILGKLLTLINGHIGKILVAIASIMVVVLGYWLFRSKSLEDKEETVTKNVEKSKELKEKVIKKYEKQNKPLPDFLKEEIEDHPDLETERVKIANTFNKVVHHNILECKNGYTTDSLIHNVTTLGFFVDDLERTIGDNSGILHNVNSLIKAYDTIKEERVVTEIHNCLLSMQTNFNRDNIISLGYSLKITKGKLQGIDHFDHSLFPDISFNKADQDKFDQEIDKFWAYLPNGDANIPAISSMANKVLWCDLNTKGNVNDIITALSKLTAKINTSKINGLKLKAEALKENASKTEKTVFQIRSKDNSSPYDRYEVWPKIGNTTMKNPTNNGIEVKQVVSGAFTNSKLFTHFKRSVDTLKLLIDDLSSVFTQYTNMKNSYMSYLTKGVDLNAKNCKRALELLEGDKK